MLRGILVTGVCRWYSRVVEKVRLHKELKVSTGQNHLGSRVTLIEWA
jgi:hypothetical protein